MLADPSPMVRGNAALSLVRFGDATGRPQILALLHAEHITSPAFGRVIDADRPGTAIRQGGLIAKVDAAKAAADVPRTIEIRSSIPGRIRWVAGKGTNLSAGEEVAVIDPATDQVWEALRALYLVGQPEDLAAIRPFERDISDVPDHVRRQAIETDQAIQRRSGF
jgi:HEAT repeat protein